ncbi:MAG: fused MFS/spermidine synthase [Candidatus Saccharicenans sp.]
MSLLRSGNSWGLELKSYYYPFLLGFLATSFQILILREFEACFYGNELVYGFVLAFWLLGGGIGSYLAEKKIHPATKRWPFYILAMLIFAAMLIALRFSRFVFGYLPAEMTGMSSVVISSLFIAFLISLPLGALFVYNVFWLKGNLLITYQLESVGAAAAGLVVYFGLIPFVSNWQAAAIIIFISGSSLSLLAERKRFIFIFLLTLFASFGLWQFDFPAEKIYWKPFNLVATHDSPYARLQVVKTSEQTSFFTNNLLAFNYPDPSAAEEAVHFALLQRPKARKVLLIGGGLNGSLEQILQYPRTEIDYVELDPSLIELAQQELGPSMDVLNDPRVSVHLEDGRRYLQETDKKYEVIISSLPEPATAQVNRFYTIEFFSLIQKKLTADGVFSFILPSSENYLSDEQAQFLASIYFSLKKVFPEIKIIPGDNNIFLASSKNLDDSFQFFSDSLKKYKIKTLYFRPELLFSRLTQLKRDYLYQRILSVKKPRLNYDQAPISYFFNILLWSKQFHGIEGKILNRINRLGQFWLFNLPLLIALLIFILVGIFQKPTGTIYLLPVMVMGFTTIMAEIGFIIAFQAELGLVFGKISLLLTMFMLGLFLGSSAARPLFGHQPGQVGYLMASQAGLIIVLVLSAASLKLGSEILFYLLLLAMGTLSGLLFAISNSIFLQHQPRYGLGYALDLLGSFLGAWLVTSVYIPLLGLKLLFSFLILVNSFCLILIVLRFYPLKK